VVTDAPPAVLYSLALLPPLSVAQPLAQWRARLHPDYAPKISPHITVKQPFVRQESADQSAYDSPHASAPQHEAELMRALGRCISTHTAFTLQLETPSFFSSSRYGSVVYLGVRRSAALDALSFTLVHAVAALGYITHGLDPERENGLFFPHLTLTQGLSKADAERAVAMLGSAADCSFLATRLVVGRAGDDGVWHRPYELSLAPSVQRSDARVGPL